MNRKTIFEIGAILSALLFFFGLISKSESRAIYVSISFLLFFFDLCLLIKKGEEAEIKEELKEKYEELEGTAVNFTYDPIEPEQTEKFAPALMVEALEDCRIKVLFENGVVKTYDLRQSMRKHEELKILLADKELFRHPRITVGGYRISWTGELCIAATEVWKKGKTEESKANPEKKVEKPEEKEESVKTEQKEKAAEEKSEDEGEKEKKAEKVQLEKEPTVLKKTEEKEE